MVDGLEIQLCHLAAGIPGKDENGFPVVFVDVPAGKKKEDVLKWCEENIAAPKHAWLVKSKKGPMKDHPFCFVNFETEEDREKALALDQMFEKDIKVIKRVPAIWCNGFTKEDTEETILTKVEAHGVNPIKITKSAEKTWAYLHFFDSLSCFEAADILKEAENPEHEKGKFHISFPRDGKEKMALRNKIAKGSEMDENNRKVFCFKLKDKQSEEFLKTHFSEFGEIESLNRPKNKGICFVTFKTYAAAYKATKAEHEGDWECQISKPDYVKKMQKRQFGGYGRGGGGMWRGGWGGPPPMYGGYGGGWGGRGAGGWGGRGMGGRGGGWW